MKICLIAAVAKNGVIGKDNDLPWDLPDDMKFFKEKTKNKHIILGRKNYESIPEKYRPLPNRTNIVLTKNKKYKAEGCILLNNFNKALDFSKKENNLFIIGGSEIYELGIKVADIMYITEIHSSFEGDVYFPKYNKSEWEEIERVFHDKDEKHKYSFDFVTYKRIEK